MTYRAAVIGCGKIGSEFADDALMKGDVFTHAEAYTRCPATELVAVCDSDPERATRCAERWGVSAHFTDVAELIEVARPDLISICTPDATHVEVSRVALSHRHRVKAILCEKPLATTIEQARELVRLAGERGVILAVAYMRRYATNMRALKQFIDADQLGTVQAVAGWYTKGTLHNGSHWFDLLRMLVGEVEWVEAINALGEDGPDPTLDVILGLKGGRVATLRAGDASRFTIFEMDIVGTRGRAQLVDSCYRIDLSLAAPSPRYSGYYELQPTAHEFGDRRHVMLHAVADLVYAVTNKTPPACSGQDGLAALQIGWAARQSAQSGQRVVIADQL